MGNNNISELSKSDLQISDKALIKKLKCQLEQCENTNQVLKTTLAEKQSVINRLSDLIDHQTFQTSYLLEFFRIWDIKIIGKNDNLKSIWNN